ncbi:hypothetical protein ACSBR2_035350 [Camellia fascicularis]
MSGRSTSEIEESSDNACFILIQKHLEENRREGIRSTTEKDYITICRVAQNLQRISKRDTEPEMVSIGPYHRDKDEVLEFQSYKWQFLDSLLSRIQKPQSLLHITRAMKKIEYDARRRYSEPIDMSSDDFIQMMLLDGCFIIELFQQVCGSDRYANANSLVIMKPWLIPILIGDLLKLENQLPFFVLSNLYKLIFGSQDEIFGSQANTSDPLVLQALKCFNLALPSYAFSGRSFPLELQALKCFNLALPRSLQSFKRRWLARLRRLSYLTNLYRRGSHQLPRYSPSSDQSMPSVTRLRHAGVKFRPQEGSDGNFLHINFHKGVLEIPPTIINDFTSTILINCVAFEQCYPGPTSKYFSTYIAFMSCLLNSSRDVTFLCDDGIISNFSYNDNHVANLFKKLGERVVFNIRDCYLGAEFRKVEAYYSSNWATLRRTYFSSPWSTISVVSASVLLALTAIQTIIAILSYKVPHS